MRIKNIYANCRSWTLSHFSNISNDCNLSNVCAYQSCTIEQSFGWKRNYRHTYRNIATLGSVLHTLLKLKTRGIFFIKKTLTLRFGSDARGDRFFGLTAYVRSGT